MLIIDSTEDGVSIRTLDSLTYLDDILVVRMTKLDRTQDMILTIIQQLGKAYNYDFDIEDVHSVYCAQLISQ